MSDKKFTLEPEHMERLRALMREEEATFDAKAPTDAELDQMERSLQTSLKKLAKNAQSESFSQQNGTQASDAMTMHWQGIEAKINASRSADGKVVSIQSKSKNQSMKSSRAWLGALAAAAVAMFVLLPQLQKSNVEQDPAFVTKGSSGAWTADCEWQILDAPTLVPDADGLSYRGPAGTTFQVSLLCHTSGMINLQLSGVQSEEIRNLNVTADVPTPLLRNGKIASYTIPSDSELVLSGILTAGSLAGNVIIPQTESEARNLKEVSTLWFDRLIVKGTAP